MPAAANRWTSLFADWPESLARRGIVITTLNEAMPFKGFMIKGDLLLLERQNPDSLGARYIWLGFEAIAAVKLIDPLGAETFTKMGFVGRFS